MNKSTKVIGGEVVSNRDFWIMFVLAIIGAGATLSGIYYGFHKLVEKLISVFLNWRAGRDGFKAGRRAKEAEM